jgi:hypothetical protein
LRNLHRRFDRYYIGQLYGGDFARICDLLRIYELYSTTKVMLEVFIIFCNLPLGEDPDALKPHEVHYHMPKYLRGVSGYENDYQQALRLKAHMVNTAVPEVILSNCKCRIFASENYSFLKV